MQTLILAQFDDRSTRETAGFHQFSDFDAAWLDRFGDQYLFTCDAAGKDRVYILTDTPTLTTMKIETFLREKKLSSGIQLSTESAVDETLPGPGQPPLSGNLARIVHALRCMYDEGLEGNFATFSYRGEQNYFVQFAADRQNAELTGDASSNNYIELEYLLKDDQIELIEQMGWESPDPNGFGGFSKSFQAANDLERYAIAVEVQAIFEKVYRVDFNRALSINLVLE
jgi:hypothetical protein